MLPTVPFHGHLFIPFPLSAAMLGYRPDGLNRFTEKDSSALDRERASPLLGSATKKGEDWQAAGNKGFRALHNQ